MSSPAPTICPTSTLRSRIRPLVGARMSSLPISARGSHRAAPGATRTCAFAASRAACLASISAFETKPRPCSATGTLVIVLGESGIGLSGRDLGCKLSRLLRLHLPVDGGQHLALAHPGAGIDQHARDLAARTRNADRLVAAGGEGAACGDRAGNLAAPRDNDRDRRNLSALSGLARRCALLVLAAPHAGKMRPGRR